MINNGIENGINNSGGYAPKMDNSLSDAIKNWWCSLSKNEILDYLRDQPDVTADALRNMLSNENCALAFGVQFSASTMDAVTDFYGANK